MNSREFLAALEGLDRARWPVQPVQAERAVRRFLVSFARKNKEMLPGVVEWYDTPDEIPKGALTRVWSLDAAIEAHNRFSWPGPANWILADNRAIMSLLRISGTRWEKRNTEYLPDLFDAYVAGAFVVFEHSKRVAVLGRPKMRIDEQGRLHHETRPAIEWPDGPKAHYIAGVEVNERLLKPRSTSVFLREITSVDNQEVRRVLIERFGWRKYLHGIGAWVQDKDPVHGNLWDAQPPQGDPDRGSGRRMRLLEVKDPSTGRRYFMRVPPDRGSAKSARAWLLRKTVAEMDLLVKET